MTIEQKKRILQRIHTIAEQKERVLVGIDGRCTSGKSSFGLWLQEQTNGTLLHMDDFFLQKDQRTPERYAAAGENVDHERFLKEVLLPLFRGEDFLYQPFDCHSMSLQKGTWIHPGAVVIVEGSYALREDLRPYYDVTVFMDVSQEKQKQRILQRNPDQVEAFQKQWIPQEEKYLSVYHIAEACDFCLDTSMDF